MSQVGPIRLSRKAEPDGIGALAVQFSEQLKKKTEKKVFSKINLNKSLASPPLRKLG